MTKNSLVLYKNQPAVVKENDGDKYIISYCSQPATATGKKAVYSEQKVREKFIGKSVKNFFKQGEANPVKLIKAENTGEIS